MVPTTLNDWTEESIRRLLAANVYENDSFDWKEKLPSASSPADKDRDKDRLRKACAAFANSRDGGFLVFGVVDDRAKSVEERLVGIDPNEDFFARFGDYPAACRPAVSWDMNRESIRLASGRLVHVVEIPPSRVGPHAITVDSPKDNATTFVFPKRTNKGTEFMNYDEVRMNFYAYHDRFAQLNVLRLELASMRDDMIILEERSTRVRRGHPATEVGTTVLERVIADCYVVLAEQGELLQRLVRVRRRARELNNVQRQAFTVMLGPYEDRVKNLVKQQACATANDLARACEQAQELLESFLEEQGYTLSPLPKVSPRDTNRSSFSGNLGEV